MIAFSMPSASRNAARSFARSAALHGAGGDDERPVPRRSYVRKR
jgi:hypothetical protein